MQQQQSIPWKGKTIILFSPTENHYCADIYAGAERVYCGRGHKFVAAAMNEAMDHIDRRESATTVSLCAQCGSDRRDGDACAQCGSSRAAEDDIVLPACAADAARIGLSVGLALAIVAASGLALAAPAVPPKTGGAKMVDQGKAAMKSQLADKKLADAYAKAFPPPKPVKLVPPDVFAGLGAYFAKAVADKAAAESLKTPFPAASMAPSFPTTGAGPVIISPSPDGTIRHAGRFDSGNRAPW